MQPTAHRIPRPLRVYPSPTLSRFFKWECRICGGGSGYTAFFTPDGAGIDARRHLTTAPHPIATVIVGQEPTLVHWIVLNLHRASQGLVPWHRRMPGSHPIPTAAEVNRAIEWWNAWHSLTPPTALR